MTFKNLFFLLLLSSVTVINYSCNSCNSGAKGNKLRVGVHSWPGGGPIYIGIEKGFFKAEGIEVGIDKIENFDTKRATMISGQIDIDLANTMDQLLIYNENNFNAVAIGVTDESTGGDGLVAKENIQSFADLKGKTIAYAEASPSDFFLRYLLKQNGLTAQDVQLKPVADPQIAGNSIISGQVDAAVTFEPFLSQADSTQGIKLLASTKQYPTLIPGLIMVNGQKLANSGDLYEKFLKAWFKSVDYLKANPEDGANIISKGMGMSISDVKGILSSINVQDKAGNKTLVDKKRPDNLYVLLKDIAFFWKASGYIKKDLQAEKMLNPFIVTKD